VRAFPHHLTQCQSRAGLEVWKRTWIGVGQTCAARAIGHEACYAYKHLVSSVFPRPSRDAATLDVRQGPLGRALFTAAASAVA
jgi:hypothetical protein